MTTTYDIETPVGKVRLLLNDVASPWVFSNEEIDALLSLEGDSIKRAAAQAIDTNADNEVLASKVLRTQDLTTDGAKAADSLRKRAAALRAQADKDDAEGDDGAYFEIVPMGTSCRPELTGLPYTAPWNW
jgi:hypothetical protein